MTEPTIGEEGIEALAKMMSESLVELALACEVYFDADPLRLTPDAIDTALKHAYRDQNAFRDALATQRAQTPGDCRWCATELDSSDGDGLCGRCSRASQECFFDTEGCCADPADHDYCGLCPLATAEHPDRNGGWPGKSSTQRAPDEERLRNYLIGIREIATGASSRTDRLAIIAGRCAAALTPPDDGTGQ